MNTLHFWFRSGAYSLLGHLDASLQGHGRLGVVMVPPFGWEDVCSYRPLRCMARSFAEAGIPTLRYDLPGTGDSSGDALDSGLLEAWIGSVADAADELRSLAGVERFAAVGVHFGAMLILAAAARGAVLEDLVLWGALAKGRALLRELRAAANVERGEYLPDDLAPPQPIPGFQAGGFLIAPGTLRDLENFDVGMTPPAQVRRILLLSRDRLPHDPQLLQALQASGARVELGAGHGYAAMMGTPQDALFPEQTARLIAGILTPHKGELAVPVGSHHAPGVRSCQEFSESIYTIDTFAETTSTKMFGILAEPPTGAHRSEYCVVYLNAGGVRHTGPNRGWVESARRWAGRGVASLRLDLLGIGESEGPSCLEIPGFYETRLIGQIEAAIDAVRRDTGINQFLAAGLCSGACWGLHTAIRNRHICGAVLFNPMVLYWDPGADRRRLLRRVASGFAGWTEFARVIRGGIQRGYLTRGVRRVIEALGRRPTEDSGHLQLGFDTVAEAWSALEREKRRITLVLREGEPLLDELEAAGQLPPDTNSFARLVRVPNGGHTFRPLWAQKLMHELIDAEIASLIGLPLPA